MSKSFYKKLRRNRGASMMEMASLVMLLSLVVVAAVKNVGREVRRTGCEVTGGINGKALHKGVLLPDGKCRVNMKGGGFSWPITSTW